jgi:hypothetical protein
MQRLIVTNDTSAAGHLKIARIGNFRVEIERQFIWGRAPSDAELSELFGTREKDEATLHWLDHVPQGHLKAIDATGLGLVEFCSRFDAIELWMDPHPNDQLQLICLLHYLRAYPEIGSRLSLVQAHVPMGEQGGDAVAQWKLPVVKISSDHFEVASRAWRAFAAAKQSSRLPRSGTRSWPKSTISHATTQSIAGGAGPN